MSSAPESCDDCVSWQSAFWALVSLLLSVMTQPCGQVCHFPLRLRTYMRCSPIVCAADNLAMIIHLALLTCSGINPRKAAHAVLMARRIENGVCESNGQGIQSVEKTGIVRTLLFVLGTLPQIIKLMALSGIPWTKVWAGLYLGSFITIELLALVAEKQGEDAWKDFTRSNPSLEHLSTIKRALGRGSIAIHMLLGIWTYQQILLKPTKLPDEEAFDAYIQYFVSWKPDFILFLSIVLLLKGENSYFELHSLGCPKHRGSYIYHGAFTAVLLTITVVLASSSKQVIFSPIPISQLPQGYLYYYNSILLKYCYLAFFFVGIWASSIALSTPSKRIQSHVLLFEPDCPNTQTGHSSQAIRECNITDFLESAHAWIFFVGTFILSISWYSTCYKVIGTHKPEWVNAFG